jgi:lipopolysaccharide/colanic/teichoic acid biosynthesis glycosyltransferase
MDQQEIGSRQATESRTIGLPLWKRALDIAIILALSPGLILIGGAVAMVVLCGSRGPVFFRQRRVGFKGREFTCFKFRTMHVNVETDSHRGHTTQLIKSETPMVKLDAKRDPRLIPLAPALRATGLDELPQLLNVLRGEMSVVGPRPCVPYEYELYEPWQKRRFDAVPGLTGLWQVSGKNRTTFSQMIQLDIEYARRMSLAFDLLIILKTLPALWRQCLDMRALKRKEAAPTTAGMAKQVQSYNV